MASVIPDRRDTLFGREPDIVFLLKRVESRGITALAARPMMGKTWTLLETLRRLRVEKTCIAGYHESKGAESSHLLYAVSDLYTHWLADSSFRAQALSLWERNKDNLIPKVGQAIGLLFKEIASLTQFAPDEIGNRVQSAFDGLAAAQVDLKQGGLQLPALDYDQARDLTNLVATFSGKKVVLVLDAWEKSQSLKAEHDILEAFVKHPEDWPQAHLFLGIRQPEVGSGDREDAAFLRAKDLNKLSAEVLIHRLPDMHLDRGEDGRMLAHLRASVPALKNVDDAASLHLVAGFPGVLDRWLSPSNREAMQGTEDLAQQAHDAQDDRYREFDDLLPRLSGPERAFCARLAFLPRLDPGIWESLQALLLAPNEGHINESMIDTLRGRGVLEPSADYPSYGHDTRHAAAARWFITQHRPLIKREGVRMIWAMAETIDRVSEKQRAAITTLAACGEIAEGL